MTQLGVVVPPIATWPPESRTLGASLLERVEAAERVTERV